MRSTNFAQFPRLPKVKAVVLHTLFVIICILNGKDKRGLVTSFHLLCSIMLGIPIYSQEMRVIRERSRGIFANGERVIYFSRETTFRRVYSLIKLNETAPHLYLRPKTGKRTRPRFRIEIKPEESE